MPINNKPKPGEILICEFPTHQRDLVDGEMAKDRLVIVMNKPLPGRGKLVNVVPISMTAPDPVMPWHVPVPVNCLPFAARHKTGDRWAKCDMISTVGWGRLNRYEAPMRSGRRVFQEGRTDMHTYVAVKRAVATVLNITASLFCPALDATIDQKSSIDDHGQEKYEANGDDAELKPAPPVDTTIGSA